MPVERCKSRALVELDKTLHENSDFKHNSLPEDRIWSRRDYIHSENKKASAKKIYVQHEILTGKSKQRQRQHPRNFTEEKSTRKFTISCV
jgi:hypothetical protein